MNTEKCEIISDAPNDVTKDNTNGQSIMPKKMPNIWDKQPIAKD